MGYIPVLIISLCFSPLCQSEYLEDFHMTYTCGKDICHVPTHYCDLSTSNRGFCRECNSDICNAGDYDAMCNYACKNNGKGAAIQRGWIDQPYNWIVVVLAIVIVILFVILAVLVFCLRRKRCRNIYPISPDEAGGPAQIPCDRQESSHIFLVTSGSQDTYLKELPKSGDCHNEEAY